MRGGAVHKLPCEMSASRAGTPGENLCSGLGAFFDGVQTAQQTAAREVEKLQEGITIHKYYSSSLLARDSHRSEPRMYMRGLLITRIIR